jgi:site-specific recombinase XerD
MNCFEQYLTGKGLSKSTVKWYNRYALDFITWLDQQNTDPDNATAGDIAAWLNHLKQKGQANITRSSYLIAVRHYLYWRVSVDARADNPAQHIKLRGIKHKILYPVLSVKELESLYHNYQVPAGSDNKANWFQVSRLSRQRNKSVLGLMIWQGLTTPEISSLTTTDLKLREGTIYIAGSRGSNERTLELKPAQVMELMEYQLQTRKELLQYLPGTTAKLFLPSPAAGRKQAGNDTVNIWKRLSQDLRAQCPKFINFLQVRSSVITHWLKQYNLRQVQHMAGHRYVSSTEAYQVNNIEELQDDINKYHPIG